MNKYFDEHKLRDINWFKKILSKIFATHPKEETRICSIYNEIKQKYPEEVVKEIEKNVSHMLQKC